MFDFVCAMCVFAVHKLPVLAQRKPMFEGAYLMNLPERAILSDFAYRCSIAICHLLRLLRYFLFGSRSLYLPFLRRIYGRAGSLGSFSYFNLY